MAATRVNLDSPAPVGVDWNCYRATDGDPGEDTSDPDTDIKEEDITEKPEGCSTSTLSSGSIGIFGTLWGLLLLRRRQD